MAIGVEYGGRAERRRSLLPKHFAGGEVNTRRIASIRPVSTEDQIASEYGSAVVVLEILGTEEGKLVAAEFTRLVDENPDITPESYREMVFKVKDITRQKGRTLFHSIRAVLTGCGSGPELEKLIPLYEAGSRLELPRKVMSCRERLHAILASISHKGS